MIISLDEYRALLTKPNAIVSGRRSPIMNNRGLPHVNKENGTIDSDYLHLYAIYTITHLEENGYRSYPCYTRACARFGAPIPFVMEWWWHTGGDGVAIEGRGPAPGHDVQMGICRCDDEGSIILIGAHGAPEQLMFKAACYYPWGPAGIGVLPTLSKGRT